MTLQATKGKKLTIINKIRYGPVIRTVEHSINTGPVTTCGVHKVNFKALNKDSPNHC